jgi:hypothetical protein
LRSRGLGRDRQPDDRTEAQSEPDQDGDGNRHERSRLTGHPDRECRNVEGDPNGKEPSRLKVAKVFTPNIVKVRTF